MAGLSTQMALIGTIQPEVSFVGTIQPEVLFKAEMNAAIAAKSEVYDDDINNYIVTPSLETDIVLPTKSKLMKENLTVEKITQYTVSNEAGGMTLILGGQ